MLLTVPSGSTLMGVLNKACPDDVAQARRIVDAYEAAIAAGQGVATLDGQLIENLHAEGARRTLALADAIRALSQ